MTPDFLFLWQFFYEWILHTIKRLKDETSLDKPENAVIKQLIIQKAIFQ